MKKDRFFFNKAKEFGAIELEDCFENITIDPVLMKEIGKIGVFSKNQKFYLQEITNRIIQYAKQGFVNGTQKISLLEISHFYIWKDSTDIRYIGKYDGITCFEIMKNDEIFLKGNVIGSINEDPFPYIVESYDDGYSYVYGGLLDPDTYRAPRYALEFVNRKLNEALPGRNLWVKAEHLFALSIYDLNVLPHMKTY